MILRKLYYWIHISLRQWHQEGMPVEWYQIFQNRLTIDYFDIGHILKLFNQKRTKYGFVSENIYFNELIL